MAILTEKKARPDFKIYVVDGVKHTAEQLAFNLVTHCTTVQLLYTVTT